MATEFILMVDKIFFCIHFTSIPKVGMKRNQTRCGLAKNIKK